MRKRHLGWLGLAALGLAACSSTSTTTPTNSGGPSSSQMTEIGLASSDELDASLSAMTITDELSPIGFAPATPTMSAAALGPDRLPMCATINPDPPTDTDGDGIPDDATITFNCSHTLRNGGTFSHTGEFRIQDTNLDNAFDMNQTLTNLEWAFTDPTGALTYSATRNGTRSRSGTANGASLSEDLTIVRTRPSRPDATIHKAGTVTFTPAEGSTLAMHMPLPSGTFTVEGSQSWDRGDEHFSFTVTTVTPLAYNAGCTLTHQRIEAGQLRFDATINGHTGYLLLTWTSCGMPPSREWVDTTPTS
jgi:hypothetical protein